MCPFSACTMSALMAHKKNFHRSTEESKTSEKSSLEILKDNSNISIKKLVNSDENICAHCNKKFDSDLKFKNHNQLLAAIRCGQCNFRSCSVEKLEMHKRTEHGKKKTLEETQTLGPKSKKQKTTHAKDSDNQTKVQNSENGPEMVEKWSHLKMV